MWFIVGINFISVISKYSNGFDIIFWFPYNLFFIFSSVIGYNGKEFKYYLLFEIRELGQLCRFNGKIVILTRPNKMNLMKCIKSYDNYEIRKNKSTLYYRLYRWREDMQNVQLHREVLGKDMRM